MEQVPVETVSSGNTSDSTSSSASPAWRHLGRLEWSWETCIAHKLQELQFLIVCHGAKNVLLKQEEGRWVLPGSLYNWQDSPSSFKPVDVIPNVQEVIGSIFPLTFLRQSWRRARWHSENNCIRQYEKSVILMACDEEYVRKHNVSPCKHEYLWMPVEQVHVWHLIEEAAASIEMELKLVENGTQPENRLSWQRPGWLCTASYWMKEQLRLKHDAVVSGEIIHLRSSPLSAILQCETNAGRFFLKCTPFLWNDAAYTEVLARLSPSHVAAPVAVDVKRQMMVTADYGEILNPGRFSDIDKERFSASYAHVQMATIGKAKDLISAGFPDFRLPRLTQ